jgi:hypothetical protein
VIFLSVHVINFVVNLYLRLIIDLVFVMPKNIFAISIRHFGIFVWMWLHSLQHVV